jgi:hypothetical protein
MKALLSAVAVIAVLVVGVFGLSFMTQNTRKPTERPSDSPKPDRVVIPLVIREKVAVWDPSDPSYATEIEKGTKGYYDFWISNPHPKPVTVALKSKSCTCAEVHLGLVPPADWDAARLREATLATALHLAGALDWAVPLALTPIAQSVKWKKLLYDRNAPPVAVQVPAADPQVGPQMMILRLGWDAKEVKSMRLVAEIVHQLDGPPETTGFEVPVVIVPPVQESTNALSVGELRYGEHHDATLVCWSSTRPDFDLRVEEMRNDPCIEIAPSRRLTADECQALPRQLLQAGLINGQTRPRCGYAVRITVYEHRDGHQLELGPLLRRLVVNKGTDTEFTVTLAGTVRGSVRVGDANDRDRIDLGSFRADRPFEKTVIVSSTEPGVQLKVADKTPDVLDVALDETSASGGIRQWKLRVGVPADALAGFLPPESAVYLETASNPPRRVRVPITGNATR